MSGGDKNNLYDILGVNKNDSCSDIKKAFLKLARIHHPDKGGDPEMFKEIHRASEILTDENKRKTYDDFGIIPDENGNAPTGSPGGFPGGFPFPFEVNINDFFGNMFGGGPKGPNTVRKGKKPAPIAQTLHISLEKFYIGSTIDLNINRQVFCKDCDHSGAKKKEICSDCKGRGTVTQVRQMGPMIMQTNGPCVKCEGKGEKILEKCDKCTGSGFIQEVRTLNIKINPGVQPGEVFVFPEVCSDHPQFERPGDAHIIIQEDSTDPAFKFFRRTGDKLKDLETTVNISLTESLMGCVIRIDGHPVYDDGLFCKVPAGSFHGDRYCISGYGMPIPGNIGNYGDLFINIDVTISPLERKLFTTKGRDLLAPLFEDKLKEPEHNESSNIAEMYLVSK